jgi:2-desacetyl-2-hydroxyethyl bacteriochlorophyllide A dehydrogenase
LQAVVLNAPEHVSLEQRADPVPGSGEVVVETLTSGICGTDVSIFSGKIPVRHPLVMGHEMFGRVIAVGPDVTDVPAGRRVVVDPSISCGRCYQCSKGQANLCPNGALLGRDRDGGFAGAVAVPARNIHFLPDAIEDVVAPLIQVLTTCMHGQRNGSIYPGDAVVILGLGVTGLMHLQLARARGAAPLIGITRSASKRVLAEKLGADLALEANDDVRDHILDATAGRGPDVVIECVGKVETFARAIELVRIGGRIVMFGTMTATRGELPLYQLYYKEIVITNPRAAKPEDFPAAIALTASRAVELAPLISHTFPLARAGEAIDMARSGSALKIVMDHSGARP